MEDRSQCIVGDILNYSASTYYWRFLTVAIWQQLSGQNVESHISFQIFLNPHFFKFDLLHN